MKNLLAILFIILIFSCSPKWAPDHYWSQKRWILTEMKGVPVQLSGTNRDAYLEFSWTDKHFTGNGGCNRISGNYELEKKKDIQFREVISTKMSCSDIAFETTFLNALQEVNKFETEGDHLLLKNGKKTILIFQGK
ncbi:MAG TPA: META domain-containing protein [Chitinophagaceae bacterium]